MQKHIDDIPELKAEKMAMNRRTLKAMQVGEGAPATARTESRRADSHGLLACSTWFGSSTKGLGFQCSSDTTCVPALACPQTALNEGGKLLWIAPSGGRDRSIDPETGEPCTRVACLGWLAVLASCLARSCSSVTLHWPCHDVASTCLGSRQAVCAPPVLLQELGGLRVSSSG